MKQVGRALKDLRKTPAPTRTRRVSTSRPAQPAVAARGTGVAGAWTAGIHVTQGLAVRRMRYRLFVPDAVTGRAGPPLVVMLHGCGQDAADFAAGTGMNRAAAAKGYAVLYPEQSLRSHPHRCWKWYDAATQRGGGDIETIADMIEKVVARHGIDRQRIYACGMSAGAAMAQLLALTHPRLVAAVGMHSGPVLAAPRTAVGAYGLMQHGSTSAMAPIRALLAADPAFPPMPAIVIGGIDDDVVRLVNQVQLVQQFTTLHHAGPLLVAPLATKYFGRASSAWPRKRAMHVADFKDGAAVVVRSVQIQGLGHAWSGGDEAFSYNAKGPDASRLMLAFFARHRRRI
ncbi:PHB depolymerase family esterase [Herbaspirillum sp. YR522]|uniref:extracellular catalytic domain type 1 short-chain-length polyhydroxyalkanoate depolymerase n=1 Tax=Herbaspirillum sp. YR522 TaxID=1144342 RepID=UPI0002EB7668|nr:PHB depolymerase family esterase [Herbaspirillum sp. YR522]